MPYDARGRQLSATTPDGQTVSKTYNGLGLVLGVTDEENRTTQYGYDAASQLTSVTDVLNQITQYGYDLSGNKTSQTDANNHTTGYVYDALNRRNSRTLPLGQAESFTYDAVGNKISRKDFNGTTTTYAYDSLNRLLSRTPDASFSALPITFTYTSTGQRATMTDPSGVTTYTYTNRDQAASKATPEGTLSYTYDAAGHVISTVSSNANGTNVAYTYDAAGQLISVSDDWTGGTTSYSYDATGQLISVQYPNKVKHVYTYDSRDRMTNLAVSGGSGALANYAQTFSFSGRKTSAGELSGRTTSYNYDSIYRLLNETIAGDPVSANDGGLSYTLDAVGNRSSLASTLAALASQSFTYDADDRISGDTFDANGNTLTSGGNGFGYDFEDRLTQFDNTVSMSYDGDGNRITRTESGTTVRYLIDDQTPTGYSQVAEEVMNGAVIRQYTYGPMRISQRQFISGSNWQLSYFGYDAGASVRQLTDPTGAVTDTYAYDAFGNTVAHTGSTFNQFQYRGEQFDSTLQIYYSRARYYRPRIDRFLTQDAYEGVYWNSLSLNGYLYSAADAVNHRDPSGYGITDIAIRYPLLAPVVAVIGKNADVETYECSAACNTVWSFISRPNWTAAANQLWLQTVINGKQIVFLASDPNSP